MKEHGSRATAQRNQVIDVMEKLNGVATLGTLYKKVDVSGWGTKTPDDTIRRIVQEKKYFSNIKLGLWGLNTHREMFEHLIAGDEPTKKKTESEHYYYQGLLLELGNIQGYQTFSPDQDKNKDFLGNTLGETRTLEKIYPFGYAETIRRARTVDVIWFNRRNMLHSVFEVEHSTDFTNGLSKYIALQDFHTEFYVVASPNKEAQFKNKISRDEYLPIKCRVKFMSYKNLVKKHEKQMRIKQFKDL